MAVKHHNNVQVRDLKWTGGELEKVKQLTPSSMTKVHKLYISGGKSESPRSQLNHLLPEKCYDRKKQSNKDKDEGDTDKHEFQKSSCGAKQADKSFSMKLKNVNEQFKGMKKLYERWRCVIASVNPRELKKHIQKLSLKAGGDVDYTLFEESNSSEIAESFCSFTIIYMRQGLQQSLLHHQDFEWIRCTMRDQTEEPSANKHV